mmetsp:Transcript_99775/g.285258  ORF Transcript_99775/g.285258 Transcript_99775/m.285258 type:complete len:402 (+) Transcript_99775:995-2200(+)
MLLVALIWILYAVRIYGLEPCLFRHLRRRAKRRTSQLKRRELEEIHHAHIEYSLLVTYLVLPTVAQAQFKGLNCLTLESGRQYLRVDTSVDCSFESRDYQLMLGITIPFILLYQAIPIVWFYTLYTNRERLNPPVTDARRAYEKRAKDRSVAHLRFLFSDYRCSGYYYEVLDMYRRIFLLGLLPFIEVPVVRAAFGCMFAALSCFLFREWLPYYSVTANSLALAAQFQILLTFSGAFTVLSSDFNYNDDLLALGLVVTNVIIVPWMTWMGMRTMAKHEAHDERTCKLQTQLLKDKTADRDKFEAAWGRLRAAADGVEAEEQVLDGAAKLADLHHHKPMQQREYGPNGFDELIAEAVSAEDAMHDTMRGFVETMGGHYDRGPLKNKERIMEKTYSDYGTYYE